MAATAFAKCFDIFVNVWASGNATIRGGMREGLAWFANTAEKLLVSAIPVAMLFGTTSFWGFRLFATTLDWGFRLFAPTFDRILNLLATGLDRILSFVLIVFVITFAFIIWAFLYDPRVDELKVLGLAYLRGFVNNQVQFPPLTNSLNTQSISTRLVDHQVLIAFRNDWIGMSGMGALASEAGLAGLSCWLSFGVSEWDGLGFFVIGGSALRGASCLGSWSFGIGIVFRMGWSFDIKDIVLQWIGVLVPFQGIWSSAIGSIVLQWDWRPIID
ncbi:uncharacterized protein RSE6_04724 [Rhynchosporium secalis]|uniref:Uncharacterized protein n=1 Tax=Rhynchosporium secalis TaxID=38038 RepID=A0A1E1M630_RHYSE|nr:uncharacterized protein RSE6_04724 [Rhynchosporium secalis]